MKNIHAHSLRVKIIFSLFLIATMFSGVFQGYAYFSLKNQLLRELNFIADSKIVRMSSDLDLAMSELEE